MRGATCPRHSTSVHHSGTQFFSSWRGSGAQKSLQRYLDDTGRFIENIQLEDVPDVSLEDKQPVRGIFLRFRNTVLNTEILFNFSCSSFTISGTVNLLLQLVPAWN